MSTLFLKKITFFVFLIAGIDKEVVTDCQANEFSYDYGR
jgi:hypothetical protein